MAPNLGSPIFPPLSSPSPSFFSFFFASQNLDSFSLFLALISSLLIVWKQSFFFCFSLSVSNPHEDQPKKPLFFSLEGPPLSFAFSSLKRQPRSPPLSYRSPLEPTSLSLLNFFHLLFFSPAVANLFFFFIFASPHFQNNGQLGRESSSSHDAPRLIEGLLSCKG